MFILCWSPYFLFDLLQVYGFLPTEGQAGQTTQAVATFIQSLSPLNSAANPLIYCLFSANLGKYLQGLWCRRHCCSCCRPEEELLSSSALRTTSTLLSRFAPSQYNSGFICHLAFNISGPWLFNPRAAARAAGCLRI